VVPCAADIGGLFCTACTAPAEGLPASAAHRAVIGRTFAYRLQCFDAVGWAAGRASGL